MTTPSAFPNGDPASSVPPPSGQFGQMPAAHPQTHHPAVPRPKAVETAFLIYLIGAGVGVVSNLINAFGVYGSIGSLVFSLLITAVGVWIAMQMRAGQNWARIVLTVLGGLGVLIGLFGLLALSPYFSFLGGLGFVYVILMVVSLAASVAAIILMFRPESNRYFGG